MSGGVARINGSIAFGGLDRRYHLLAPTGPAEGPRPLVVLLHGGGGMGEWIARIARIAPVAEAHGFLVCCPDGHEKRWNDGRPIHGTDAPDDVGFLLACIDHVAAEHGVDRNRVYIGGASNGAMLAYRTIIERPGVFAAAAGVMSPLHLPYCAENRPTAATPIAFIHGTADPVCPFEGGTITLQRKTMGEVMSFRDSVRYWVEANGCGAVPEEDLIAEATAEQPMRVWRERYPGTAEVAAYIVEGGGHTWPGGEQYAPEFVIGPTCRGFSASEHLWAFFAERRLA